MGVVDPLEVVEVDEDDRARPLVSGGPVELLLEPGEEGLAVERPRSARSTVASVQAWPIRSASARSRPAAGRRRPCRCRPSRSGRSRSPGLGERERSAASGAGRPRPRTPPSRRAPTRATARTASRSPVRSVIVTWSRHSHKVREADASPSSGRGSFGLRPIVAGGPSSGHSAMVPDGLGRRWYHGVVRGGARLHVPAAHRDLVPPAVGPLGDGAVDVVRRTDGAGRARTGDPRRAGQTVRCAPTGRPAAVRRRSMRSDQPGPSGQATVRPRQLGAGGAEVLEPQRRGTRSTAAPPGCGRPDRLLEPVEVGGVVDVAHRVELVRPDASREDAGRSAGGGGADPDRLEAARSSRRPRRRPAGSGSGRRPRSSTPSRRDARRRAPSAASERRSGGGPMTLRAATTSGRCRRARRRAGSARGGRARRRGRPRPDRARVPVAGRTPAGRNGPRPGRRRSAAGPRSGSRRPGRLVEPDPVATGSPGGRPRSAAHDACRRRRASGPVVIRGHAGAPRAGQPVERLDRDQPGPRVRRGLALEPDLAGALRVEDHQTDHSSRPRRPHGAARRRAGGARRR